MVEGAGCGRGGGWPVRVSSTMFSPIARFIIKYLLEPAGTFLSFTYIIRCGDIPLQTLVYIHYNIILLSHFVQPYSSIPSIGYKVLQGFAEEFPAYGNRHVRSQGVKIFRKKFYPILMILITYLYTVCSKWSNIFYDLWKPDI
jgi:hypothetical protein